ncbi:MAG: hypothetical protein NVSMB64_03610 [Candidatus Velthaea sp.]
MRGRGLFRPNGCPVKTTDNEAPTDTGGGPPALAGVNIGGTSTTIVAGDPAGNIHAKISMPTDRNETGEAFYTRIVTALRATAPHAGAIGVAVGGPVDAKSGVVTGAPHLPHLWGFPLRARLRAEFGVNTRVHHDAAACALAEYLWGPDAGASAIAYLTCGTGFGTGIVLNGAARYGSTGLSPEIGHVRFRDHGPDIFGKPGCYEGYGSANAIALLARERNSRLYAGRTPAAVVRAALCGETGALDALRANEDAVGAACALLADLLVVDVVSLGSLATYLGEPWLNAVRNVFSREALPQNVAACTLRAAMSDVQDLSALAAARDAWQETGHAQA